MRVKSGMIKWIGRRLEKVMLSDKLISFLENQEKNEKVSEMSKGIRNLIIALLEVKENLAKKAAELYLENDSQGIQRFLKMSHEIDDYIRELSVLDFETGGKLVENQNFWWREEKYDIPENIRLGVVTNKKCPECKVSLIDNKTEYVEFTDKRKRRIEKKRIIPTYECPTCGECYIHKQLADLLDISRTNIELVDSEEKSAEECRCMV